VNPQLSTPRATHRPSPSVRNRRRP
jgi:hypothetical protein